MNSTKHATAKDWQGKWWRHLLAGGVSEAVTSTITAPMDAIKFYLQVNKSGENMRKCLSKMISEDGVLGLWRGNGIYVIKILPETTIKFCVYEQVKRLILGDRQDLPLNMHEKFGTVSQTLIYPLDVLQTRLRLGKTGQYSGILDAARKMYVREGVKYFYKGYVPYADIDLAVYETLKLECSARYHRQGEQPSIPLLLACRSASYTRGLYVNAYMKTRNELNSTKHATAKDWQGKWWRHLLAGGVAEAVTSTITAPMDALKFYLQVNKSGENMRKCLSKMISEGGVLGLWRGNGINVIKILPETTIKFCVYEQVKGLILGDRQDLPLNMHEKFVAWAAAGTVSQTLIYPLDVLQTRLRLGKTGQYSGILDAARKMYVREGVKYFYKGYVPYAGIDLAVYETLKLECSARYHRQGEQPSIPLLLACRSASYTLGLVCTYPLALICTRIQAQEGYECTTRSVYREIMQYEGIFGLYRGITPNFIKVIPAMSITYVVHEFVSRSLGVHMT